MKRIYWRPKQISRSALVLIGVLSVGGVIAVESMRIDCRQPNYELKIQAATLARQCFEEIKAQRLAMGISIDAGIDPTESGLIGEMMTPVTSVPGDLPAKQTTINPNFAAMTVDMLERAGVKEGDKVAVAFSGSFPALNASVCAALEVMRVKPVIISSVAASQWGANIPELLWVDMERALRTKRLLSFASVAASLGGHEDLGLGLTKDAKSAILAGIERNELRKIEAEDYTDAVSERMAIYYREAGNARIKAYVNVGGGAVATGRRVGKRAYQPGLNLRASQAALRIDSVMTRFMREGVPVLHLVEIKELAENYGLSYAPAHMPELGEGKVFFRKEYNRWLVAGLLVAIVGGLYAFVLSDVGLRILKGAARQREAPYSQAAV